MKGEYGERGYRGFSEPPVKEGEAYKVKIESVGRQGDGLAKVNGFVVFVADAKMGEEMEVRITKVARRVAFAEKVE